LYKQNENFVKGKKDFFYNLLDDLILGKEKINESEYRYVVKED
jgi:hypothetical protein